MTMRQSRIPLFLYLIFKQKLAEAFPLPSEDYTARNFLIPREQKESVSLFEAKWSEGRSCFCEAKQGWTRAKTERKNRRTLSRQKGRGFQIVAFFLQIEISFLDKHSLSSVFG